MLALLNPLILVPELRAGGSGIAEKEEDGGEEARWGLSGPSGAPEGSELRLPALVHPDELLDFVVSLGAIPDAATKWFLY